MVHGLDRLTAFLRQAHVPTPDIERAWRTLATRRVHSIPRVGLTPAEIEVEVESRRGVFHQACFNLWRDDVARLRAQES